MVFDSSRRSASLYFGSVAALVLLASCQTAPETQAAPRGEISVDVAVTATQDASGAFDYAYDGAYFDGEGNFDFSQVYDIVHIKFTVEPGSPEGMKFKADGAEAMWIVEKINVGPDGSPRGRYQGTQFYDFTTSADGRTLSVTDTNDDGVLYRYGLRFDYNGATVVDDPDGQNGPHD